MTKIDDITTRMKREIATVFYTSNPEHIKISEEVGKLVEEMFKVKNIPFTLRNMEIFAEGMDCFMIMSGNHPTDFLSGIPKIDIDYIKENRKDMTSFLFRMWLDHKMNMESKKIEELAKDAIK